MHVLAINGSPRKTWNTATLLTKVLEGAAAQGASIELVHLYDLDYKGCTSCFACKLVDGPSNGRCAMQDQLRPVLERIETKVDALVLGSPIYFAQMTGEMRSFLERLLFAPLVYSQPPRAIFPRTIKTAVIYTMNVDEEQCARLGYPAMFEATETVLDRVFGIQPETLCCYDTYQFPDYGKVIMECMDSAQKAARRSSVFPEDCKQAVQLGARLATAG
ncbi:MAG: flavodoxin family protein [Desulfobulbus sp.]|jgi:multimeric flavodoxin WrbA|uniref:flavodoxin family protein n=1 Tax=Desulfobulbus sp. TaxID=895 RepID=UPI0028498109|nr:flavodoxin family protein [Desulfobulbus sp.]MDR2550415.1 flavodoxin family protein [Desulfobulbus sp.]